MSTKPRDFLERPGQVRFSLQRDIAEGKLSPAELRAKYNASSAGIRDFGNRHAAVIAEMRANLEDKLAGLWVADKQKRVAAYMADIELVDSETERVLTGRDEAMSEGAARALEADEDGELLDVQLTVATDLGRLSRIKHRALRSVAEELGQLPTRMVVKSEGGGAVHVYGADVDTGKV